MSLPAITEEDRITLEAVLRSEGLDDDGASPHSWRCEYPDRYPGACQCVSWVSNGILDGGFRLFKEQHEPEPIVIAPVDPEEADTLEIPPSTLAIPPYALLDVWLALGLDSAEFDDWFNGKDQAEAWAELMAGIRHAVAA